MRQVAPGGRELATAYLPATPMQLWSAPEPPFGAADSDLVRGCAGEHSGPIWIAPLSLVDRCEYVLEQLFEMGGLFGDGFP